MSKHAYLIIAHNHWDQLRLLLQLLDDPRNDIYIHIDKKCKYFDQTTLEKSVVYSKVFFSPRVKVQWGGYSQIQSELILMEQALQKKYDYLHLISGVDLPLKTQNEIHGFFETNKGKEFIQFNSKKVSPDYLERIKYYRFFQERCGREKNLWFYLDKISVKLQKLIGVNRLKKCNCEIQKGTNWFSITSEFAKYVIEHKNFIAKTFKYSFCSDELFLQTMLINSEYKDNLYDKNFNNNHYACLRKIDWERGNPYTFRKEDYEELITSSHLFARKFDDEIDKEIIEQIREYLGGQKSEIL